MNNILVHDWSSFYNDIKTSDMNYTSKQYLIDKLFNLLSYLWLNIYNF